MLTFRVQNIRIAHHDGDLWKLGDQVTSNKNRDWQRQMLPTCRVQVRKCSKFLSNTHKNSLVCFCLFSFNVTSNEEVFFLSNSCITPFTKSKSQFSPFYDKKMFRNVCIEKIFFIVHVFCSPIHTQKTFSTFFLWKWNAKTVSWEVFLQTLILLDVQIRDS